MYDVHDTAPRDFIPPSLVPYTFGPLQAIAQLRLEYADGSVEIIGTDETWRVAPGPITFPRSSTGEDFDARLVPDWWDQASFNDSSGDSRRSPADRAGIARPFLRAPPIRAFEVLPPVATHQSRTARRFMTSARTPR